MADFITRHYTETFKWKVAKYGQRRIWTVEIVGAERKANIEAAKIAITEKYVRKGNKEILVLECLCGRKRFMRKWTD